MFFEHLLKSYNRIIESAPGSLLLLSVVLMALSLIFPPSHSLWLDETSSIFFAKLSWEQFFRHLSYAEANMSLYYLFLKLHMLLGGDGATYIRSLSFIFSLFTVLISYSFAKAYLNKKVAFYAGLLIASNPFLYQYAWEARAYSMLAFFGVVNLWLFWRAFNSNVRTHWLLYGFIGGISLYSHLFLGFLIVSQLIFLLVDSLDNFKKYGSNLFLAVAVLFLISLPLLIFFLVVGGDADNISWIEKVGIFELWNKLENLFVSKFSNEGVAHWLGFSCAILLCLCAVRVLSRKTTGDMTDRLSVYFVCCVVVPVAILFSLQLLRPVFVERYIIYIVPIMLLLICTVVSKLASSTLRSVLFAVLLSAHSYGMVESAASSKFQFREMYQELGEHCARPSTLIFTHPGAKTTFSYYSEKLGIRDCVDQVLPAALSYKNFYKKKEFSDIPRVVEGEVLWVVFAFAGAKENSIYKLHDEASVNALGMETTFSRRFPNGVYLIRLEHL